MGESTGYAPDEFRRVEAARSDHPTEQFKLKPLDLPKVCTLACTQMDTISFSDPRAQLAATMDWVIADHAPVVITRHGSQACVLVSLEDWQGMEETNYLRSSPANAQRLLESVHELAGGS